MTVGNKIMGTVRLTKSLGGYDFKIRNRTYHIYRFDETSNSEWIIRNEKSAYEYSDPIRTLREVRKALADMQNNPDLYEIK